MRAPRLARALALPLAVALAALPHPALADGACRAEGSVELSSKLVCPNQPVELSFELRLSCAEGATPSCVRAVRIVDPLPAGIAPWQQDDSAAEPNSTDDWSLEFTDGLGGVLKTSRSVVALHAGTFALGGAEITVEDDEGRMLVAHLEPASLTVVPECPRADVAPLFLPIVHRPSCIPSRAPLDLVLAIDRSASVGSGLGALTRGAGSLLHALNLAEGASDQWMQGDAHDRAAIVAFDGRAELMAPLGSARTVLFAALAGLQPRHGTRFEHALDVSVDAMGEAVPGRKRIVVLVTDGVAIGGGGDEAARSAATRARATGVRILPLGIGPAPNWSLLRDLAEPGAPHVAAREATSLPKAFRAIVGAARCLRTSY